MKIAPLKRAAKVLLAVGLAGCVSRFELELPREHPAEPAAPTSGPLAIPDPSELQAPVPASGDHDDGMHEMHGAPMEHGADSEHPRTDGEAPHDGDDH